MNARHSAARNTCLRFYWQRDSERRALVQLAGYIDLPVVQQYKLTHDSETKTDAFFPSGRFGASLIIFIENVRQIVLRDSKTGVFYHHANAVGRTLDGHGHTSAGQSELHRITQKIIEDLRKAQPIGVENRLNTANL